MFERETFGRWIKRQRLEQELTQTELAHRVGCAVVTLRKIEADSLRPSQQITARLLEQLGVPDPEHGPVVELVQSAQPLHPHNLPTPLSSLIGRASEVAEACEHLRSATHLLILTGPGGIGKTRLAIEIARRMLHEYADGAFFVDLAPIHDPELVLPTIAKVLELREQPNHSLRETLARELREKQMLLVLDGFERLLPSAPHIAALLTAAPGLRVLVTSRAVLHLSGEYVLRVPPLYLPTGSELHGLEANLSALPQHFPAIALFIERARMATPRLPLTAATMSAICAICARLDGLPLAIELAAARCRLFTPQVVLARLEQRLDLLTGGPQDLPARQQTLRATLDWSYALLKPAERQLLQQLAIFNGGCTLAAAEAICRMPPMESRSLGAAQLRVSPASQPAPTLLESLATLLDHSLLSRSEDADGQLRFDMLDTIREYALEELQENGQLPQLWQRYSSYYLAFAEAARPQLRGGEQGAYAALEAEHDNLRAILSYNLGPAGDTTLALQLASTLWRFWQIRGYYSQGRTWLLAALAKAPSPPTPTHARALHGAGILARCVNDLAPATALIEQSLTLYRAFGDQAGTAQALCELGCIAIERRDYTQAYHYCNESLTIARAAGATTSSAWALHYLGHIAWWNMDYSKAEQDYQEGLSLFQAIGDRIGLAYTLWGMARNAKAQRDYQRAARCAEESLKLFHEMDYRQASSMSLYLLGEIALAQGKLAQALALYTESRDRLGDLAGRRSTAAMLMAEGLVAELRGDTSTARARYDSCRHLFGQTDDPEGLAQAMFGLAMVALIEGDVLAAHHLLEVYTPLIQDIGRPREAALGTCLRDAALASHDWARAVALLEYDLAQFRRANDYWGACIALRTLSIVLINGGALERALLYIGNGLALARTLGDQLSVLIHLMGLATIALRTDQLVPAARLCGAIEALAARLGSGYVAVSLWPPDRSLYMQTIDSVRARLDNTTLRAAWEAGRVLDTPQAIDAMLAFVAKAVRAANLEDTPAHQRAELDAAQAELDAFIFSISHDLQPPLRTIDSSLITLEHSYLPSLDAHGRHICGILRTESKRVHQLIDELLIFSQLNRTPLHTAPIDMTALVSAVFSELTPANERTRLAFHVDTLPPAIGDPSLIRQVWLNLLNTIANLAYQQNHTVIQISGEQTGGMLRYLLQNTSTHGEVIHARNLVGPFQRQHHEPEFPYTTVSLAIAQRIVQRHGGHIWAERALNQGTTLTFTLPARSATYA